MSNNKQTNLQLFLEHVDKLFVGLLEVVIAIKLEFLALRTEHAIRLTRSPILLMPSTIVGPRALSAVV